MQTGRLWLGFGAGLLLASMVVGLLPRAASAYEYRVPIYIQDEDDINELLYSEDITEEERDRLIAIYRDPVDINDAGREDLYNLPGLTYAMVDAIIERRDEKPFTRVTQLKKVAGIDADTLAQLQPFVTIVPVGKKGPKVRGDYTTKIRVKAADEVSDNDDNYPEGYVRAEVKRNDKKMAFGAATTMRNTVGPPAYKDIMDGDAPVTVWKFDQDGNPKTLGDGVTPETETLNSYLETDGRTVMPSWPKIYAMYAGDDFRMLAGSYRVGFGQRLVLDTTGNSNPHGFAPDLEIYEGMNGFTQTRGFFGAVGTAKTDIGAFTGDATAFFSWWRYDIYQYDLKHKTTGPDGEELASYVVATPYKQGLYRKLSYVSLPEAYSETLGGANVTLNFDKRNHVGFTGYASNTGFWLSDSDTEFSRSSPFPQRDFFYAMGVDAALGIDAFSLYSELGMMDNQALAGIVRGVTEIGNLTLEASYRYYGFDYDNPHSRGYGMADEFEGDRDKGEQGFMLTARYKIARFLAIRMDEDVWQATQWKDDKEREIEGEKVYPWRMESYLRLEVDPMDSLRVGTFVQMNDKDLSVTGRDHVYAEDGERYQWGLQAASRFSKTTTVWLYYKLALEDANLADTFQKSHYITAKFATRPWKWLGFAARAKYLKGELEELQGATREHFLEGYFQVNTWVRPDLQVGLRGMLHQDIIDKDPVTEEDLSFSDGLSEGEMLIYWKAMVEWVF